MIELKIKNGECSLMVTGGTEQVIQETLVALHAIKKGMDQDAPTFGSTFFEALKMALDDESSILYAEDINTEAVARRTGQMVRDALDRVLDTMPVEQKMEAAMKLLRKLAERESHGE